ncbi:TetR/AcrR family transcriptional regulator [Rhabdothermincola salaria]|uniref:TetR/AcrR family transcriptional regulator n=1 Tax=Rhabdothermincola salaria TaxID=2903142 RepID=UPI001E584D08|nr:TetR/AcrR family transcriptional regulator [Rhabdothermincola salaria]MCD9625183.1 TetR/AcrR family transcriptional regulator [Rhabdothermincola salaria]
MGHIEEPLNVRSRRTRAAALDATWRLLEEEGPRRVTMAAVAERAGITRRALYLHFPTRGELLLALHRHVDEQLDLEGSLAPVLEAPDSETTIAEFSAHLARYHFKISRIDSALLGAADSDPEVAALLEHASRVWHEGCRELVGRLAREDRLAEPWTIETGADLVWSFMFPETLQRLTAQRNWSVEQYRELLTVLLSRTLLNGAGG